MPSPKEKILKFLSLEIDRKYDNKAVVGGLERVQQLWEMDAREARLPDNLITAVSEKLVAYKDLPHEARSAAVEELMGMLGRPTPQNKSAVR